MFESEIHSVEQGPDSRLSHGLFFFTALPVKILQQVSKKSMQPL